jgi:outer membrane receptor protein involved in Fe transport
VNGIPLSAIDRIEVLPTSASGIYGGSAIGGVINIILKKDYTGGEIRATYDNTFNTDSPTRTVAASYGFALEGGKTHVMLNASWSDSQPLLLEDRRGIYERNLATILRNDPLNSIYVANFSPFQGSLPNIMNDSGGFNSDFTLYVPDNLVLKNGTVLNGGITHVSAGTSPTTSAATLTAGLVANAGSWNTDLPATTQSPTGLFQPFGATPKTKSFQTSVNRQMLPKLEVFADFSYNENSSKSVYNPFGATSYTLAPDSPINPFTTSVDVSIPDATRVPMTTDSVSRSFTVGAIAQLPWSWTSELDYTWSQNRFQFLYYNLDSDALAADLESGAFNPFVDSLQYPLNVGKYLSPEAFGGTSTLDDIALRGSGPLGSLPWGTPDLTLGLEQRTAETPANTVAYNYPISTDESYTTTYFGRRSVTDSVYGELTVPLIKKDWLPLVHALELQLSGRGERYKVDTGTPYYNYNPSTGTTSYPVAPTLNGQPVFSKASYTSTNGTAGLKYQPVSELTLRASEATAFLPPTPDQLITNPLPSTTTTPVTDPNTGQRVRVTTLSGGNPNLKPQTSKSFDAGIIWEPHWSVLKGLRLDAEYYKIEQDNAIGALSAQTIVSLQSLYPNRVIRNSAGTITEVDISSLNLYKRDTEGWDLSADYTLKTGIGTFNLNAAESIILHLQNQYSPTLPDYDAVNFPSENGAAKYKANATLGWEWHNWSASWTARYFGSYKQYGAAGGPDSTQYYAGADDPTYTVAQGSDTIPSQTYHDFFLSYAFGKQHASSGSKLHTFESALLDGLTVQLGVRNIFNKVPPFDYYYSDNYYESPYGDLRLRSYWLSVKKTF